MIVVGLLAAPDSADVVEVARRAAATGSKVEVVGLVPGDLAWDSALYELAKAGAGHATVVRSARSSVEPADLELALRYLPDIRVVVLVRPPAPLLVTALAGTDWAGATLVLVGPLEADAIAALDASVVTPTAGGGPGADETPGSLRTARSTGPIVLDPPDADPDGTFAGFVAALAVRLDAGDPPEAAFRATVAALAVDPV